MTYLRTCTSDSSGGACVLSVADRPRTVDVPISIFLRHNTASRWCGAGGDWLSERHHAVRFATNIDALVYCQALDVRGLLVAFDAGGNEIYRLNVDTILDTMADDPCVRSLFHER